MEKRSKKRSDIKMNPETNKLNNKNKNCDKTIAVLHSNKRATMLFIELLEFEYRPNPNQKSHKLDKTYQRLTTS